ncbi:MAG: nitroreductase family protein [Thermoplasmatales archaeon]|nr:nitroreductase family protein [Thermoplasmatales archaeon]
MMDAIRKRRSIRKYKSGKIDEKDIIEILENAILAPSAGNLQSWEFVLVKTMEQKKKLADAAFGQDFILDADFVVVVCADQKRSSMVYGERGYELYSIQDTAAAIENILLTVTEKGFGACWVGAFDESMVRDIINCPAHVKPVAVIPVGIPDEKPNMPERIPLRRVLHWERF